MRRSVFTKYMVAFALIIFISFIMLAFIMSNIINHYANQTIREDARDTSFGAANLLTYNFNRSIGVDFTTFISMQNQNGDVENIIGGLKNDENGNRHIVLITDATGLLLVDVQTSEGDLADGMTGVPATIMDELHQNGSYAERGKLDGYLSEAYIVHGCPVLDREGNVVGAVFACSSSAREAELVRVMNRTVIMASLWVMLAAVIAVYFMSERITSPLRTMTEAAKSFAQGKLDTRVEIHGNDEIGELGKAFNNMAESLQETETMRNSFLANVSHDLRTPMTTIAGFVDGMLSGAIPPEKQPEYLEIVSSEVHRLSRLVSQILDVSKLESGDRKFTNGRFDICEMARLILISFEQKIEEKRLDVQFECDEEAMFAYGDKDAIHQVLYNLCDNAQKFSREGGIYRIGIHSISRDALSVSVYNEGQGIPEEDLPYVFDRFYKSDKSRSLDKVGVGLGLYIVKTILEAQHQKIEVKSAYGENCEFSFTLTKDKTAQ